jgi:hypothetical protein
VPAGRSIDDGIALFLYYVVDGGSEVASGGRIRPKRATTIKEIPMNASQAPGPFGPSSSSLFGIQPRPTTTRGKAEILAMVAPDLLNHESRDPAPGDCPMSLIVNGTREGGNVTPVQAPPLTTGWRRDGDRH